MRRRIGESPSFFLATVPTRVWTFSLTTVAAYTENVPGGTTVTGERKY